MEEEAREASPPMSMNVTDLRGPDHGSSISDLQTMVFSSPSFSLGIENFLDNVKTRGPFPPAAVDPNVPSIDDLVQPSSMVLDPMLPSDPISRVGEDEMLSELDDVFGADPQIQSSNPLSKEFLVADLKFRTLVSEGGDNPSKGQDRWALNRLKKFREFLGQDTTIELVDMAAADAVEILCIFFERVTKKNGELYPSGSLMNLLGGFNRTLRRKQEERIMASGVNEAPFTMKTSPLFRRVCVACVMAMRRSRSAGVGTERKQVKVVTKRTETDCLADSSMAKTHSRGLFCRTGYYCMFRFSIRGGGELHRLQRDDFTFGQDSLAGKFVQYHERTSKNGKATMKKFQPEHFRPAVKIYEEDVVDTFERYYTHLPDGMSEFFLAVIDNPRTTAWYSRSPMGERTLSLLVKQIFEENGLDPDDFSNKSGRTTLVTRMGEAGVPPEVGMLVTGHASEKAYARYDRSKEAKVRAAQRCATEDTLTYVQALEEETCKLKVMMIDGATTDESPPKRLKSIDDEDSNSGRDSVAAQFTTMKIDEATPPSPSDIGGLTTKNLKGKRIRKLEDTEDPTEWDWMRHFDWESDLKLYEENRGMIINPISAILGKLVNCDGITINFNGNLNFRC